MTIYVASSWRNYLQPAIVQLLRKLGHKVYDFREGGFNWSNIEKDWKNWSLKEYKKSLDHELPIRGFAKDFKAMNECEACVLVCPCGRSAHLEAGFFANHPDRQLFILMLKKQEPELMYKMADEIFIDMNSFVEYFDAID